MVLKWKVLLREGKARLWGCLCTGLLMKTLSLYCLDTLFITSILRTYWNAELYGTFFEDVHSFILYPEGSFGDQPFKTVRLARVVSFVKDVFKGLAFYTANNLENTETASKKLKHTLEETKRDIIRQVLITAAPLDFLISGLLSAQFQQKAKEKKTHKTSLLMCSLQ